MLALSLLVSASLCIESGRRSSETTTTYPGPKTLHLNPDKIRYLNYRLINYGGGDYPTAGKPHSWCARCRETGSPCKDAAYLYVKADLESIISGNPWTNAIADNGINAFSYELALDSETIKTADPLKPLSNQEGVGILFTPLTIDKDHTITYCIYLTVDGVQSNKACKTITIHTTC